MQEPGVVTVALEAGPARTVATAAQEVLGGPLAERVDLEAQVGSHSIHSSMQGPHTASSWPRQTQDG